jgi:precorrin-6B methylase 2
MKTKINYYEAYGMVARKINDSVLISGRNSFQGNTSSFIVKDIACKMRLNKTNVFLEIGCGTGLLLSKISPKVSLA